MNLLKFILDLIFFTIALTMDYYMFNEFWINLFLFIFWKDIISFTDIFKKLTILTFDMNLVSMSKKRGSPHHIS